MANPLANLGSFRDGTTDYAAGRARTIGEWHLVRKEYGDNSSVYSYARFMSKAEYLAARNSPHVADWRDEPYSSVDYTLLLLPLATPLPISTEANGPVADGLSGGNGLGNADVLAALNNANTTLRTMNTLTQGSAADTHTLMQGMPARNTDNSLAIRTPDNGAALLVEVKRAISPPTLPAGAATETTLAAVRAQLAGTLTVSAQGTFWQATQPVSLATTPGLTDAQLRAAPVPVSGFPASQAVTGTFWPTTQPVSGPATDAQLRATPLPVSGFPATYPVTGTFWQSTQPVSAATLPLPVGASTYAAQQLMQAVLDAIKANTTGASTAALQAAGNAYLQTLATAGFNATVVSGPVTPYSLVVATGNNATSVRTGATQLTSLTVTNATAGYKYLMLYNLAGAPATGAAPLLTLGVPPGASLALPVPSGKYLAFPAGLAFAVGSQPSLGTLVAGLLGTTGVAAADMVVNLTYTAG